MNKQLFFPSAGVVTSRQSLPVAMSWRCRRWLLAAEWEQVRLGGNRSISMAGVARSTKETAFKGSLNALHPFPLLFFGPFQPAGMVTAVGVENCMVRGQSKLS